MHYKALAFGALVFITTACSAPEPAPPAHAPPVREKVLRHAELRAIEQTIQRALGPVGGTPDYETIGIGAAALHAGADRILDDRPESVGSGERTRYEGFVAQLRERAQRLREAAGRGAAMETRRAYQATASSCAGCHYRFRSVAAPTR